MITTIGIISIPITSNLRKIVFTERIDITPDIKIMMMAYTFAFRGILLFSCQSLISGPKVLLLISQLWNLSEELAKHASAKSNSGVVGSKGKNMPKNAKPVKRTPIVIKSGFCI
jgi:hypothetical protein